VKLFLVLPILWFSLFLYCEVPKDFSCTSEGTDPSVMMMDEGHTVWVNGAKYRLVNPTESKKYTLKEYKPVDYNIYENLTFIVPNITSTEIGAYHFTAVMFKVMNTKSEYLHPVILRCATVLNR
jgi:hypothetical protein